MKTGYVKPWFPRQLSDHVTGEVWVETTHGVAALITYKRIQTLVCQQQRFLSTQAAALWYLMIRRKMLRLFTAGLLLLAACFGGLVLGELSNDFSQCRDFFHNNSPPRGMGGPEYQPICQRYKNAYRFASLYHRQHRAPLYSAYQLKAAVGKRPGALWMYEPQVTKTTVWCGKFL